MFVSATTAAPLDTDADTIAIGVIDGERIPHDLPGQPLTALVRSGEASSERGRIAVAHAAERRFLLVGLGARAELTPERARQAAGVALGRAQELRSSSLCWEVPHHVDERIVGALVEGSLLRGYRFDRYKRPSETARSSRIGELTLSAHDEIGETVRVA
ncbi:MAG TPA: M17 family peptidase N-terminal domain-containing protein, partial [Solirubrobacteraceae bacterium]|nr:M17 family peptidase N-terminal domain-containing protein [Solirubrobacteraceae bacterium]